MKNLIYDQRSYLILFTIISISACSLTGGDPVQVKMSDLVGLWNSSEMNGFQKDVIYTRISSSGGIIEYDYDGDEVDQGLACYQIDSGAIKHIEENRFLVSTDMHANKQFEVELQLLDAGHALQINFLDSEDIDADENYTEVTRSQIWTREPDTSILDNEPSCRKE
jgi:hypothetical protein